MISILPIIFGGKSIALAHQTNPIQLRTLNTPTTLPYSLIFDCDGVIVDSEIVAVRVALRKMEPLGLKVSLKDYSHKYAGHKEHEILSMITAEHGIEFPPNFLPKVNQDIRKAMVEELEPISGMPELLKELPTTLSVVSNSNVPHVQQSLKLAGVADLFGERIFSADHVEKAKPHPDVYLLAFKELGYDPATTLVVEDSIAGVTAAKAAGATVVGFLGASHIYDGHGEKLEELGVDMLAEDAPSLREILLNWKP